MNEITIVFQTNNIKTKFTVHREKGMKLYISIFWNDLKEVSWAQISPLL
jgi:hypothetical protein